VEPLLCGWSHDCWVWASYANGSEDGAETQAVLMSVFHTLKQRGHNPVSATIDTVRAYLQTGKLPSLTEPIAEYG